MGFKEAFLYRKFMIFYVRKLSNITLDKTSNINKGFTYDYVMKEINDQEELFVHISENILDIDCLSKIDDIVAEIQETKNTVLEINLENTIT